MADQSNPQSPDKSTTECQDREQELQWSLSALIAANRLSPAEFAFVNDE